MRDRVPTRKALVTWSCQDPFDGLVVELPSARRGVGELAKGEKVADLELQGAPVSERGAKRLEYSWAHRL
jgi:hypothetical protein